MWEVTGPRPTLSDHALAVPELKSKRPLASYLSNLTTLNSHFVPIFLEPACAARFARQAAPSNQQVVDKSSGSHISSDSSQRPLANVGHILERVGIDDAAVIHTHGGLFSENP